MLSEYQQQLRDRVGGATVNTPPAPWRFPSNAYKYLPIGGLQGVGFGIDPGDGSDLLMVTSMDGHGVIDPRTYAKVARDRDPDPDFFQPSGVDLSCQGLGPLAGIRVPIAGLFGGGLHATTEDGLTIDVVAPEWPNHRVLLSTNGGTYQNPPGLDWWPIFDDTGHGELRAAGFSPTGRTVVIATSSDITIFIRDVSTTT
jgi:hypothetical protein